MEYVSLFFVHVRTQTEIIACSGRAGGGEEIEAKCEVTPCNPQVIHMPCS